MVLVCSTSRRQTTTHSVSPPNDHQISQAWPRTWTFLRSGPAVFRTIPYCPHLTCPLLLCSINIYLKFETRSYLFQKQQSCRCVKFICKKHCKMHQIYRQKTLGNASNLHAKNTAKCIKFIGKKHCETRRIYMQETLRNASIFCKLSCKFCGVFLHINLTHF